MTRRELIKGAYEQSLFIGESREDLVMVALERLKKEKESSCFPSIDDFREWGRNWAACEASLGKLNRLESTFSGYPDEFNDPRVAIGIICDTKAEAEEFLDGFGDGFLESFQQPGHAFAFVESALEMWNKVKLAI